MALVYTKDLKTLPQYEYADTPAGYGQVADAIITAVKKGSKDNATLSSARNKRFGYRIHACLAWKKTKGSAEQITASYTAAFNLAISQGCKWVVVSMESYDHIRIPREQAYIAVSRAYELLGENDLTVFIYSAEPLHAGITKEAINEFWDMEYVVGSDYTEDMDEYAQAALAEELEKIERFPTKEYAEYLTETPETEADHAASVEEEIRKILEEMNAEEEEKEETPPPALQRDERRRPHESKKDYRYKPGGMHQVTEERKSSKLQAVQDIDYLVAATQVQEDDVTRYVKNAFQKNPETFHDMLLRLIDDRGLKDSQAYTRANIDRRHFSKIRSNEDYQPTKGTVLAFCISLGLSKTEAEDLLKSAGYSFSPSSVTDVVVLFYIEHGIYDIYKVNADLYFIFHKPILGSDPK